MNAWHARIIDDPEKDAKWQPVGAGTYIIGRAGTAPFRVPGHRTTVSSKTLRVTFHEDGSARFFQLSQLCLARVIAHDGQHHAVALSGIVVLQPRLVLVYNGGQEVLRIELTHRSRHRAKLVGRTPSIIRAQTTRDLRVGGGLSAMEPGSSPTWQSVTLLSVVIYRRKLRDELDPTLSATEVADAVRLWHGVTLHGPKLSDLLAQAARGVHMPEDPAGTKRRTDVARRVAAHALRGHWVDNATLDDVERTLRRLEYASSLEG